MEKKGFHKFIFSIFSKPFNIWQQCLKMLMFHNCLIHFYATRDNKLLSFIAKSRISSIWYISAKNYCQLTLTDVFNAVFQLVKSVTERNSLWQSQTGDITKLHLHCAYPEESPGRTGTHVRALCSDPPRKSSLFNSFTRDSMFFGFSLILSTQVR